MKSFKKLFLPFMSLPIVAAPLTMTSCSVYKNVLKDGYKVNYSKRTAAALTLDEATVEWNNMLSNHSNFLEQEIYKNADVSSRAQFGRIKTSVTGLEYSMEFTVFQVHVRYAKIVDSTNNKVSFKYAAEIEEKDKWYYNNEYVGYGIDHYTIDWELKNIAYKVLEETDRKIEGKQKLYIAPQKFNATKGTFDQLVDNEQIIFNLRELIEIYGQDGIQSYGAESKEAGTIDKDHNFVPTMQTMINFICSFYSYYLWDCSKKA